MKTYPAGIVQERKSRKTGTTVLVVNAAQYGVDTCITNDNPRGEPWATICDKHGAICNHSSLTTAKNHAGDPTGWCEQCFMEVDGKCVECGQKPAPRYRKHWPGNPPGVEECDTCNYAYGAPGERKT